MKIIKYFIDGQKRYLIDGVSCTEDDLRTLRDRLAGRRDRRCGMYNEWYRQNRKDRGKAYDQGCKDAEREPYIAKVVVTVYV